MDDFGDVGGEVVAVGAGWAGGDGAAADFGFAGPLGFVAVDEVGGGAVEGEAGVAAQVGAFAGVGHAAEGELAVGDGGFDAGDAG